MAKQPRKIKNVNDLWDFSETLLVNLESGFVKSCDGKEQFNGVGKMLGIITKKLEYQVLKKKVKGLKIDQLED